MDNQLREYKRISARRNVINLKRQLKLTAALIFVALLLANLVTIALIYFTYEKA